MPYTEEFIEYCKRRRDEINKILSLPHKMNKKELEICYKRLRRGDFFTLAPEEEIAQEKDLEEYIKVLMRWK